MRGVQVVTARIPKAGAVSLLLAGSLNLLSFLLPYHQLSVLRFDAELAFATIGIATMLDALGAPG